VKNTSASYVTKSLVLKVVLRFNTPIIIELCKRLTSPNSIELCKSFTGVLSIKGVERRIILCTLITFTVNDSSRYIYCLISIYIFKNCFLQAKEQGFGTQKQWEKGGEIPPEKNV